MDLRPHPDVRHLACIGLMGAGKTTIGRRVADRLGWGFLDVDAVIEARTGCSITDLWQVCGESAYRPLERDIVVEGLNAHERTVVAAPCDIVVDHAATHAIGTADVVAVYLRAQPETLARRIAADDHLHSFLDDHPEDALRTMFLARDHCYEDVADHVVQVDELDIDGATDAVLDVLTGSLLRPA